MKKIGKYIVCGMLGKGGMSTVYKARLPVVDRIVALKLLSPHPNLVSLLGMGAIRSRFISEAFNIASLRSPYVVQVLDFDFHGETPFFTMEYYYQDLGRLIGETYRPDQPSRILSLDRTIGYLRRLLAGLARLHRAGIVHRDIKPGNLMIADEDRIKICDFGLSKVRGERFDPPSQLVVGSPFYASPEQERDPDRVDPRADLYSVGVIAHRMLTGLLPEEGIRKAGDYSPDADADWDRFIEKALQPDPRQRFSTAPEMLSALEDLNLAWKKKKEAFCRQVPGEVPGHGNETGTRQILRSAPAKVGTALAPDFFSCDNLLRPLRYSENRMVASLEGKAVLDPATGLCWQASGSEDPLGWEDAHKYVESLNQAGFGACSRWRLPTVDELLSILRRPGLGIYDCIAPLFDKTKKVLWSRDRCTFISAWHINVEIGCASFADFTCHFFARAVTEAVNIKEHAL